VIVVVVLSVAAVAVAALAFPRYSLQAVPRRSDVSA
jgi:hypothetical protein